MPRRFASPRIAALAVAGALAATPAMSQKIALPGLASPATILVDTWGVPHIYAAHADDLYFVQGFNAARDRLFQIDLWRRRGLGRLASVFGPNFIEQDRAARLFLYRGEMQQEWRSYGPNAQRIATRFVEGINAYIDLAKRDPSRLPFEFRYFDYAPEKWLPEDVVRIRSHGLARNATAEFTRALVTCRGSLKADEVRQQLSHEWKASIPEGLNPCVPLDLMRDFTLGTQGVLVGGRESPRSGIEGDLMFAMAPGPLPPEGSNAWVVGPGRSATGRPILASDPHRAYSTPSLRYIVHLNAPGVNVIGGGEPALPGVSIGHNGTIAFGLTIFSADQEDLVAYETHQDRPNEYRYKDGWEKMTVLREDIPVRGRPPVPVELRFTRHGPVIHGKAGSLRAWALRSTWFEPGMAPYFGSIEYMNARNFTEFRKAMSNWGAPPENQVYADKAGNIGWVVGGRVPKRPNWDGLLPVPGDGRYEWNSFWAGDQLPWSLNPAAGWIASANEMNMPAGYPVQERKLGFEWPAATRWDRIAEVLKAKPRTTVEDHVRLQSDVVSGSARRIQAVLRAVPLGDAHAQAAAKLLANWNAQVTGDSPAAALYEVWLGRHLGPQMKDAAMPRNAAPLVRTMDAALLLQLLERPGPPLPGDAMATRNEIVERSLAAAWSELQQRAGPDPSQWRWDKLHQALLVHPLAAATDDATKAKLNVGPMPKQGGSDTVNISAWDPASLRQVHGASFRVVIDVGDWDNSRAVNTPGQSGDPASPHYRDLAPLWLKGETFPLLYTRAKVEAAAVQRIELVPGK